MPDKLDILRRYFGLGGFRPGQERLVDDILSGRDCLGIMPTGGGKSLCYQLPAMLLPGLTLVVSPLISLMKDQVDALRGAGIPAACLNSSLGAEEYREVLRGLRRDVYRLLYMRPSGWRAPPLPMRSAGPMSRSSPWTRRTASHSGARISGPATSR